MTPLVVPIHRREKTQARVGSASEFGEAFRNLAHHPITSIIDPLRGDMLERDTPSELGAEASQEVQVRAIFAQDVDAVPLHGRARRSRCLDALTPNDRSTSKGRAETPSLPWTNSHGEFGAMRSITCG